MTSRKLASLVARIFANWGLIEYRLSLLLIRILSADAAPTIAMFSTLTAQHLQLGALEAAAKAELTPQEHKVFVAAMSVTERVQTPRNQLAHWIWGISPELPDALLLAEPKSAKERDHELALALERNSGMDTAEMARLNSWNPEQITVYREGDLERADRDIDAAAQITFLLVIYLDGLFRGRRKPQDSVQAALRREHIFQQLYAQRPFREGWDRPKKDSYSSRQ